MTVRGVDVNARKIILTTCSVSSLQDRVFSFRNTLRGALKVGARSCGSSCASPQRYCDQLFGGEMSVCYRQWSLALLPDLLIATGVPSQCHFRVRQLPVNEPLG